MERQSSKNVDPPYPAFGGLFQHEAIMLLRRFYIQENENGAYIHRQVQSFLASLTTK